jgi:hypothetical protein
VSGTAGLPAEEESAASEVAGLPAEEESNQSETPA